MRSQSTTDNIPHSLCKIWCQNPAKKYPGTNNGSTGTSANLIMLK